MKKAAISVLLFGALTVLAAGCATAGTGPGRCLVGAAPSEPALEAALGPVLQEKVSALYVAFGREVGGGYAAEIIFASTAGYVYEGDVYTARSQGGCWSIQELSYGRIDRDIPVTEYELTGTAADGRKFSIISGVVNDRSIATVTVQFGDGSSVRVRKNPISYSYAVIQAGTIRTAMEVTGYSPGGIPVYQRKTATGRDDVYPV